jgi:uncharacterized membrane protein
MPDSVVLPSPFVGIRNRVVAGILVIAPIMITFWIVYWLFTFARDTLILPLARLIVALLLSRAGDPATIEALRAQAPWWIEGIAAPLLAVAALLGLLYFLGFFLGTRMHRLVDGIFRRMPIVTPIYNAVRQVFEAIERQRMAGERFSRVVLIEFPHPGVKCPAFVTSACRDVQSGRNILCVYVPTTPIPTSGYMLMIPEDDVVDIEWSLDETLRAIISGGITVPAQITYDRPSAS